jgi:hypothetical protein
MPAGSLADKAEAEVRRLHAFFVAWFRGEAADFSDCERAFAGDFRMVTPDGAVHARTAVIDRLRAARASTGGDFAIEIAEPRLAWRGDEAVLLEYVERQHRDGQATARRATGLFTEAISAPGGVLWRHVQETWIR